MGKTGKVQWLDHNFTSKYKQKFCMKKYDAESVTLWVHLTD